MEIARGSPCAFFFGLDSGIQVLLIGFARAVEWDGAEA
jgi:hypothetical protein